MELKYNVTGSARKSLVGAISTALDAPTNYLGAPTLSLIHICFDPYERKVLGVTAMQKLLGKSRFDELLAAYIEKPQGKPCLLYTSRCV